MFKTKKTSFKHIFIIFYYNAFLLSSILKFLRYILAFIITPTFLFFLNLSVLSHEYKYI